MLTERESKHFSWLFESELDGYKERVLKGIELLRDYEERYNLIFDILDRIEDYNYKIGKSGSLLRQFYYLVNKSLWELKVIKRKWDVILSELEEIG